MVLALGCAVQVGPNATRSHQELTEAIRSWRIETSQPSPKRKPRGFTCELRRASEASCVTAFCGGEKMSQTNGGDTVLYERQDGIATITFNRPNKLNAFDDNQVRRLGEALRRFDIDPEAQVGIVC